MCYMNWYKDNEFHPILDAIQEFDIKGKRYLKSLKSLNCLKSLDCMNCSKSLVNHRIANV